tara:strand:- start:577 stop:831 length:255 start_codon:yes stop_codon:yes gene_type:complete
MSSVNLSDADVYIKGLTVNGDLKVKGILFMAHDTKNCPSELLETNNKDVIFNENTVFEGNLHVLPSSDLNITGSIVSGELRDRY